MACNAGPKIVNDGLVLAVDAKNTKSYPGSGTTWTDMVGSGIGTLTNGPTYTQKKLGPNNSGLVLLDGVDDELTIAYNSNLKLTENNDWTVEFWMNARASSQSNSSSCGIWAQDDGAYTGILISTGTGGNVLFTSSTTGSSWAYLFQNMGSFTDDVWNHVALTKSGSTVRGFVNGSLNLTITSFPSTSFTDTSDPTIGAYGGTRFTGYLSNLRLIKGTALYTSSFTPPTAPLTAVTNTTLLTCQGGTSVVDASSSNHTITNVGGVQTADSFFDSIVFDGTDDYVDYGSSDDFAFGTGDYTIEVWCNPDTTLSKGLISISPDLGDDLSTWQIRYNGFGKITFLYSGTNSITSSSSVSDQEWTQVVATRSGTALTLYINAVSEATGTSSANLSDTGILRIGTRRNLGSDYDGKIPIVRLYKGKALTQQEIKQNYNATRRRYGI